MPKRPPPPNTRPAEHWLTPAVVTALIALLGTVIAACVSSPALEALINRTRTPPDTTTIPAPADASQPLTGAAAPGVTIEGPTTAALGAETYFTIISSNAVRGEWSISGFQNDPVTVEPLGASHSLYVQPTDATRIGDSFVLVFTVYDDGDNSASAQHRFQVVAP